MWQNCCISGSAVQCDRPGDWATLCFSCGILWCLEFNQIIYFSAKVESCHRCYLSVCLSVSVFLSVSLSVCLSVLSVCDQDNSRTCLRTSTKHGRHCQGDDPLEAFKFWCWSESGCKVMLAFPRLLTLQDMTWYDILSLVRGRYSTSLRQCSDFGGVCAL